MVKQYNARRCACADGYSCRRSMGIAVRDLRFGLAASVARTNANRVRADRTRRSLARQCNAVQFALPAEVLRQARSRIIQLSRKFTRRKARLKPARLPIARELSTATGRGLFSTIVHRSHRKWRRESCQKIHPPYQPNPTRDKAVPRFWRSSQELCTIHAMRWMKCHTRPFVCCVAPEECDSNNTVVATPIASSLSASPPHLIRYCRSKITARTYRDTKSWKANR